MDFDPLLLARIQFAFTITFHIIFPTFTIGLSAYIATLEVMWLYSGKEHYHRLARFWTKIFAVSFAMGVVSGIVLSYQFGTNWSRFSEFAGNVIGPLMGYEVLTAFFLEATFLGIMLFGWDRVPKPLHVFACIAVAVGTLMSAFWILAANSWMHTPQGHVIQNGVAIPADWLAIIFNPSFPYRLAHMTTAAYLTTSFVVLAVGARYLLAGKYLEEAKTMLRMGIGFAAIVAPLQLFIGDQHGLNTLKHQPIKIAAMEGHWDGSRPGALVLFAWPDETKERNLYEISIPYGASLILTYSKTGLFPGLKSVPPQDRPPVKSVFFSFRIMVGIGFFMIASSLFGALLWWRKKLFDARWYLWPMQHTWWMGFVAVIAGWMVTEQGRQPWVIQGIMRTADAISPVAGNMVFSTLVLYVAVYAVVFSMGIYYINRLINVGPKGKAESAPKKGMANRPFSGAGEANEEIAGNRGGAFEMEWYLPVIWAAIIGFAVAMYVILDGFDLGLGILFPFARTEKARDQMMNTVAPFWDGNETWLVLGGAGLLVAFPVAYAILMPAFYLPVTLMLLGLVLRGVSFEFRWIARSSKWFWNFAFAGGSIVAAFMQGVILGGMISGVAVKGTQYAGGSFDWFTPFALMCGLAIVAGYALLGATWLIMKTEGEVAESARRQAMLALYAVLLFMAIVSLWTPLQHPRIAERWFSLPNFLFFWPVPFVTAILSLACWYWIRNRSDALPFLCAIGLFFMGYSGLVISNFPYLVPPVFDIWQTAAAPASSIFSLMGTLFMFPILIGYTIFIYWIFRGKIKEGEGYH